MSMALQKTNVVTLIQQASKAHNRAIGLVRTTLEAARESGAFLLEAKAAAEHGEFQAAVKEHFEGGLRTSQRYMKLARNWDAITAKATSVSHLDINGALALLVQPRADTPADNKHRHFADWSPESRRSHCQTWWDAFAKWVLLYDATGWPVEKIVVTTCMPAEDVEAVLNPQPHTDVDGTAELFTGDIQAVYRAAVWCHIHFQLEYANLHASWAAEAEGFPGIAGGLENRSNRHRAECERLQPAVDALLLCDNKPLGIAVDMHAVDDMRDALGIEPRAEPRCMWDTVLRCSEVMEATLFVMDESPELAERVRCGEITAVEAKGQLMAEMSGC